MALTEQQIADRTGRIGSSMVSAICTGADDPMLRACGNPWRGRVWALAALEGRAEPPAPEAVALGDLFELPIGMYAAEILGIQVRHNRSVLHLSDWAAATPDFVGDDCLLEVKHVGSRVANHWRDDPHGYPQYVYAQLQWQLGIWRRPVGYIAAVAGGYGPYLYQVEANPNFFSRLQNHCHRFYEDHFVLQRPLPPDGSADYDEALSELYPGPDTDSLLDADDEVEELLDTLRATVMRVDELTAERRELEQRLKKAIGSALGFRSSRGAVKWQVVRGSTSWKAVAEALAEGDVDRLSQVAEQHRGKDSRRLQFPRSWKKD